jgi:hypothetical protein
MANSEEMNKATSTAASHRAGANALCLPWLYACFGCTFAHFPSRPRATRVRKPWSLPWDGSSFPGAMGDGPGKAFLTRACGNCAYLITAATSRAVTGEQPLCRGW